MQSDIDPHTVSRTWSGNLQPPAVLPESADIVIIGGGIVGVSTAWCLARQGISVAVCEKGYIAGEQSGRNWGWVRQQGRDERELPMMMESMQIWRELEAEIGEDVGFTQSGCLFMAQSEKQIAEFEAWLLIAKRHGLDTRMISGGELDDRVTDASSRWRGALYTASDGCAEPHKAAPAIARAAMREGASILTACAVRGIETAGGAVSAVVTEHGTIRTSTVLCAAGAWSALFCRSLGIALPQLRVRSTVVRTAPGTEVLQGCVFDDKVGIRRRQDGGYNVAHGAILDHSITPTTFRYCFKFLPALWQEIRVLRLSIGRDFVEELRTPKRWPLDQATPFEHMRVLDPVPNPRVVPQIRKNLGEVFPALAMIPFVETWAGMVETVPDVVPVISPHEKIRGFHIATGFSGHGFGIGPGAGKVAAGMLTGDTRRFDLSPFRLSRFFDGSPIRPQPSV